MRSVSIVIPTLNCAGVLTMCLASIAEQDYPRELVEIVIADGGSVDDTLIVAKSYTEKIYPNPLQTGEAGKAIAVKHAQNEIVAFIDSDNVLPSQDWLLRMVEPFEDEEVVGAEPLEYTYRSGDGYITRYCALLGMNDPLCLFLGNYDRQSVLTGTWTGLPVALEERGNWLRLTLQDGAIPTIGANGTLLRRQVFAESGLVGDYLFDIDVIATLCHRGPVHFAKVKTGIVHLYCGSSITLFLRKQRRRINDFHYYQKRGLRSYPWQRSRKRGVLKFAIASLTVFPLLGQTLVGYRRKPDPAWLFHPLACWLTLWTYGWASIRSIFRPQIERREQWRQ